MLHESTTKRILKVFFDEPKKQHYLKEISRKTDIAHTSVKPILEKLKKQGIIKERIEKRGSRDFPMFLADFQKKEHKALKRLYNLESLMDSGIIEHIIKKTTPSCIYVFGSYSRGEDTEDSDIDIFIEAEKKDIDNKTFENVLKRKIEPHFNPDFRKYPKELKNNIINGTKLYGHLEAF